MNQYYYKKRWLFLFVLLLLHRAGSANEEHPSVLLKEFIFTKAPFISCHASTIVELPNGALFTSWFGGTKEGAKDVGIWASRLTEMGWEQPKLLAKDENHPCWNPVLCIAPRSKDLLLFYKIGSSPRKWEGYIKRSRDGGYHWSQEEKLPFGIIGPTKNKPLIIGEDTLVCGSSRESLFSWDCLIEITKDEGKTWNRSNRIGIKDSVYGIIQPALFLKKNGSLAFVCRARKIGKTCLSQSDHTGCIWSEAIPIDLPTPTSGLDIVNLTDGNLIAIYNHSSHHRYPLSIAMSTDDGWT